MYYFNLRLLPLLGACLQQRELVDDIFPGGIVPLNEESFNKCANYSVDLQWLVDRCLIDTVCIRYYNVKEVLHATRDADLNAISAVRNEQNVNGVDRAQWQEEYDAARERLHARIDTLTKTLLLNPANWKPGLLDTGETLAYNPTNEELLAKLNAV